MEVTYQPQELNSYYSYGRFTFDLPSALKISERRLLRASLKLTTCGLDQRYWQRSRVAELRQEVNRLRRALSTQDFEWEIAYPSKLPSHHVANLVEWGSGTVWCTVCGAEYPNATLAVYDWRYGESSGSEYRCPNNHTQLSIQTGWGVIGEDYGPPTNILRMPRQS